MKGSGNELSSTNSLIRFKLYDELTTKLRKRLLASVLLVASSRLAASERLAFVIKRIEQLRSSADAS